MTIDAIRGSFVTTKPRALTRVVVLPALLALASCSVAAAAVNPVIHDEGGFFKEETIQKANEQIAAINRTSSALCRDGSGLSLRLDWSSSSKGRAARTLF